MNEKQEVSGNYFSSLWKFFASVKLTVVVLLTLAALSIIGTLIPQNENPTEYFRAFGPFLFRVLDTLDVFDMYGSWWFQGLIVLLGVNIVVCSIDRLQTTGRTIFTRNPKFNLENYRRRRSRQEFRSVMDIEVARGRYEQQISKQYGYCRVVPAGKGYAITAEKGRWTRLGVYVVHLSVVVLLIGALIGSIKGFEGFVNIPEGESTDTIQLRYTGISLKLPFAIKCDDFDVQFYKTGAPKEFRSKLTLLQNGRPVLQKDVIVNHPIRYKGINIFQASYGKLDTPGPDAVMSDQFELSFKSVASGMIYTRKVKMNQSVEIPEGLGAFKVDGYDPAAKFRGMAIGPALKGVLTPKNGAPVPVVLPIRFPKFDTMRRGAVIISVENASQMQPDRYYTGLQVTMDPGVGIVYLGFILMIVGCIVTFFMAHQQVVVELQPKGKKGIAVMVSGKSNKNKVGLQYHLQRMVRQLEDQDPGADDPR